MSAAASKGEGICVPSLASGILTCRNFPVGFPSWNRMKLRRLCQWVPQGRHECLKENRLVAIRPLHTRRWIVRHLASVAFGKLRKASLRHGSILFDFVNEKREGSRHTVQHLYFEGFEVIHAVSPPIKSEDYSTTIVGESSL